LIRDFARKPILLKGSHDKWLPISSPQLLWKTTLSWIDILPIEALTYKYGRIQQAMSEMGTGPAINLANGPSWVHENPFLDIDYQERDNHGSVTLRHLATKMLLRDQRLLNPSLFEGVPWPIAYDLWSYLCDR
jgi:hypothetical protein